LSGSSHLTCLAWEALPVAYATTSIALEIMWPHKPHHYVKVGIPSGGSNVFNYSNIKDKPRRKTVILLAEHVYCTILSLEIYWDIIQATQELHRNRAEFIAWRDGFK
jgi:hypothetical protein